MVANGREFTGGLLTNLVECLGGGSCRVCGKTIEHGERARHRPWSVELAHEACGWFRPGEGEIPRDRFVGGSFRSFLEWRCTECGLDAAVLVMAQVPRDLRCSRCEVPKIEELAALREPVLVGKPQLRIPEGHVVRVLNLLNGWAHVTAGGLKWVMRAALLRRVLKAE